MHLFPRHYESISCKFCRHVQWQFLLHWPYTCKDTAICCQRSFHAVNVLHKVHLQQLKTRNTKYKMSEDLAKLHEEMRYQGNLIRPGLLQRSQYGHYAHHCKNSWITWSRDRSFSTQGIQLLGFRVHSKNCDLISRMVLPPLWNSLHFFLHIYNAWLLKLCFFSGLFRNDCKHSTFPHFLGGAVYSACTPTFPIKLANLHRHNTFTTHARRQDYSARRPLSQSCMSITTYGVTQNRCKHTFAAIWELRVRSHLKTNQLQLYFNFP